ncbi:hypothetical protein K402DRAFT_52400 [Aulographum hederae CBS 113979]|uniref:Uncharacterized protein n=1 Tax=Aulographum hederae CBS 113979 TaxID=1176131 RepID=A0A6G1H272_9PEZI|nr:hypothetical protein K402DRAFT_52400 [Aulographum hederae CBS 113979]
MRPSQPSPQHATTSLRSNSSTSAPRPTNFFKATMNRFLTRKKARKPEPEPKVELDLAAALPSSDNFRTSLLMPNLSARFSMLREQDDPNSKLGKASDDSVLQPRRQSRLYDFGFTGGNGLADIAEVSSVKSSIRRPFANERQDSVGSMEGYGTDDESVSMMSRARPGEGNVLFGGRQKIYKIPIGASGSTKSFGAGSSRGGMVGRPVYEDDVSMSEFQRMRQEEQKRERERERLALEQNALSESPPKSSAYSPSLSGWSSRRRGTASSTTSNAPRSSTATVATSVASRERDASSIPVPPAPGIASSTPTPPLPSGLERSNTRTKRLYDQGLDRDLHDQQSSAMTRLNSIKQRGTNGGSVTPPYRSQSRQGRHRAPSAFRTASPSPAPLESSRSNIDSAHNSPPVSPISDVGEGNPLASAINPADRGKATALGAFNKPQKFDEQQYLQRQMRMQQGRETPTFRNESPSEESTPDANPLDFGFRNRSRSTSSGQKPAPTAFSVFQKAANQMKVEDPEPSPRTEISRPESRSNQYTGHIPSSTPAAQSALYDGPHYVRRAALLPAPTRSNIAPPVHEHPAFRSNSPMPPIGRYDEKTIKTTAPAAPERTDITSKEDDSELTLSRSNPGLSTMVRQHMRTNSNVSSIYSVAPPAPLAVHTKDVSSLHQQIDSASHSNTPAHSSLSHSNPWDLEDLDTGYQAEDRSRSSGSPTDQPGHRLKHAASSGAMSNYGRPSEDHSEEIPWQQQMKKAHSRGLSSETQAERDAFAEELVQRQRDIQEKLKKSESIRSPSPTPTTKSNNALKVVGGILRTKSSRDSISARHRDDSQHSKALKMLGLGGSSSNVSLSNMSRPGTSLDNRDDDRTGRMRNPRAPKYAQGAGYAESRGPSVEQSREPSGRRRSPSASRAGRYKDDLDKAMAEGTGSRTTIYTEPSPMIPDQPSPAIPEQFQSKSASNSSTDLLSFFTANSQTTGPRMRSNSRPSAPGYLEKTLPNPQTSMPQSNFPFTPSSAMSRQPAGLPSPGVSPRPSPGPYSPGFKSSLGSTSTSYSANTTPPISNSSTPVHPYFPHHVPMRTLSGAVITSRKKSINKADISEPKLISKTSHVDLVDLPAGASLQNGMNEEDVPPVPPINPKRRRFGFGRAESSEGTSRGPSPSEASSNTSSTWSADEFDRRAQVQTKTRIRKSSSDKNLNARARHQMAPATPMPTTTAGGAAAQALSTPHGSPPVVVNEAGMF